MRLLILFCLLSFSTKAQVIPQYIEGSYTSGQCVVYNFALYEARKSFYSTVTPSGNRNWQYKGILPIHYVDKTVYVNKIITDPACIAKSDSLQKRAIELENKAASGLIIKGDVIRVDTFKRTIRW